MKTGLLALCVDTLRHEDGAHVYKPELLEDFQGVDHVPAEPAGVVHQDYIECTQLLVAAARSRCKPARLSVAPQMASSV